MWWTPIANVVTYVNYFVQRGEKQIGESIENIFEFHYENPLSL